jgi:hypothetical protein
LTTKETTFGITSEYFGKFFCKLIVNCSAETDFYRGGGRGERRGRKKEMRERMTKPVQAEERERTKEDRTKR